MSDDRRVEDLSVAELEAIIEERRRLERAREFAESDPDARFRPITVEPLGDMSPSARRAARKRSQGARQRNWRDRLLLLVEVGAVLGLAVIIVSSLGSLQTLNQEVVQAQRAFQSPTAAPASATVKGELPGASFPPADANLSELPGSSFPPEELPAALGVNVQGPPALPPPTPGPHSPTRIVIPKLAIDWPIVEGDSWEDLKRGVGHHIGSANPGERGNMVLSGHDDVFGEVFKDLDQLEAGDVVLGYAGGHAFRYEVRAKRVVSPSELTVLNPTREPVVTLITCTPYRVDSMRFVVIAQLVP
jgi:sortase A